MTTRMWCRPEVPRVRYGTAPIGMGGGTAQVVVDGVRSNIITWATPPTRTSGGFTAVTAGREHSYGLKTDRTITCWGWNDHGQTNAPA